MSDYVVVGNWNVKDGLPAGSAGKTISGDEFETEFQTIAGAVNSKAEEGGDTGTNFSCASLTATSATIASSEVATLDYPQVFTKAHPTLSEIISLSSDQTANLLNTNVFLVDVQGDGYTLDFSNATPGVKADFIIRNQGAYDIVFEAGFFFSGGEPTITSGSGKVDLIQCVADGASNMYCTITKDLT